VLDIKHGVVLVCDRGRHFVHCPEPFVVDFDDGDHPRNLLNEGFVSFVQVLEVLQSDAALAASIPHRNAAVGFFWGDVQVDNDVWLFHKIAHVLEEVSICAVVPVAHQPAVLEHFGKNGVLVDGAVLNTAFALPNDDLLLGEPFVEEVYLHRERFFGHIFVKISEIDIVFHRFVVNRQLQLFGQSSGKRRLASANETADANEYVLHRSRMDVV